MRKILFVFSALWLLAFGAEAQIPAYLPTYGLSAWFPFTGNGNDSSGHGHNGTVHGTTNAAGRYGVPNTALSFNGTSDYIYVPSGTVIGDGSTDITSSLTISAWVKSQNYLLSGQEQIYWRGDPTPAHDPHMLYFNGGEIRIRRDIDPGTTSNEVGTPVSGLDTNYHMFTGTYDSATSVMSIYVDGVRINTAVLPGLETYPTATMYNYIGAVDGGTWQFFYGVMDELGLWNRALTPCEVAALYYSVPNIITTQPRNDTVAVGSSAVFTVHNVYPSSTYQWQENTGSGYTNLPASAPYAGVTTPTLTISPVTMAMSGRQYRCVPASGTCLTDTSSVARLVVSVPSAITGMQAGNSLAVVPNPNKGTFCIVGSVAAAGDISVALMDMAGKQVYAQTIASAGGKVNATITPDKQLHGGMYLLRLSGEGVSKTEVVFVGY